MTHSATRQADKASIVPEHEVEQHMQEVRSRLAEPPDALQARAHVVNSRVPMGSRKRLVRQALDSTTVAKRVLWLRREADLVLEATQDVSACGKGCSHCCNIGTFLSEPEAIHIGKAIGRSPARVPEDRILRASELMGSQAGAAARINELRERINDEFFGVPCTFLRDSKCTIYDERPMACRHLISMDVDALLCRLVPGETIRVPYLNMQSQQVAYVAAMGMNARIADIRDWFPRAVIATVP